MIKFKSILESLQNTYGTVIIDKDKKLLLLEPAGHWAGYVWTFAKGHPDPGESPHQTAARETKEETGISVSIKQSIGTFNSDLTKTEFFLAEPLSSNGNLGNETSQIKWVGYDEAKKLISLSTFSLGKNRDLAVLEKVKNLIVKA